MAQKVPPSTTTNWKTVKKQTRKMALILVALLIGLTCARAEKTDGRLSYVDKNPPKIIDGIVPKIPSLEDLVDQIPLLDLARLIPAVDDWVTNGLGFLKELPIIKDLLEIKVAVQKAVDISSVGAFTELVNAKDRTITTVPYLRDFSDPQKTGYTYATEISGELRRKWLIFQEASRWHVQVSLNTGAIENLLNIKDLKNPYEYYATSCITKFLTDPAKEGINKLLGLPMFEDFPNPAFGTIVPKDYFAPNYKIPQKLKTTEPGGDLESGESLISSVIGTLLPRVKADKYCDGASLGIIDVPWVYVPSFESCLETVCFQAPNYPYPIWINEGEIRSRTQNACNRNVSRYQKYLVAAYKHVYQKMPMAMNWDGLFSWHDLHTGVVFAPIWGDETAVFEKNENPKDKWARLAGKLDDADEIKKAKDYFKGKEPGGKKEEFQQHYPGKFRFEELKRWIEPGTLGDQEKMGYAAFFEAYASWDTVADPRPTRYWATTGHTLAHVWPPSFTAWSTPINLAKDKLAPDAVVSPVGCMVLPTWAGIMGYSVPRVHSFNTVVAEGYRIPKLEGDPLVLKAKDDGRSKDKNTNTNTGNTKGGD
jgi:hypothetical protein